MSFLRKRSTWVLPTAVIGILTLGLAGCGGDDDDTPTPPTQQFFTVPQLPPIQAQGRASIAAGQGGQARVTDLVPATFGGVTGLLVDFPVGTAGEAQTYGIAVLPAAQGSILALQTPGNPNYNPNALNGTIRFITPIAELLVGTVNPDGTINTEAITDALLDYDIDLAEFQAVSIQNLLNSGNRSFEVFRVQNGVASPDRGCEVQFVRDPGRSHIRLTKCKGGRTIVTIRPNEHLQGGGSSR